MKHLSILAATAAMLTLAGPVRAQQLDLATVTCKDFVTSDKQTISLVLMWLEAYYTEPDVKLIVDFDKMKADGEKLGDYCGKNPGHSVITAADDVLGK